MNVVKVEYEVRPEFAAENKANIERVLAALRANPIEGMTYSVFAGEDGHSFVHINMSQNEDAVGQFTDMPEFMAFREALQASNPVSPPQVSKLSPIGASHDLT